MRNSRTNITTVFNNERAPDEPPVKMTNTRLAPFPLPDYHDRRKNVDFDLLQWESQARARRTRALFLPLTVLLGVFGLYHARCPADTDKHKCRTRGLKALGILYSVAVGGFLLVNAVTVVYCTVHVGYEYKTEPGVLAEHVILASRFLHGGLLTVCFFVIVESRDRLGELEAMWLRWLQVHPDQSVVKVRCQVGCVVTLTVLLIVAISAVLGLGVTGHLVSIDLSNTNPHLYLLDADNTYWAAVFQVNLVIAQVYCHGITGLASAFVAIWCVICAGSLHALSKEVAAELVAASLWAPVAIEGSGVTVTVLECLRKKYVTLALVARALHATVFPVALLSLAVFVPSTVFLLYSLVSPLVHGDGSELAHVSGYLLMMLLVLLAETLVILCSIALLNGRIHLPLHAFLREFTLEEQQKLNHPHQTTVALFMNVAHLFKGHPGAELSVIRPSTIVLVMLSIVGLTAIMVRNRLAV